LQFITKRHFNSDDEWVMMARTKGLLPFGWLICPQRNRFRLWKSTVRELEGVERCKVNVVTDPPWSLDRVSDYARVNMSVVN